MARIMLIVRHALAHSLCLFSTPLGHLTDDPPPPAETRDLSGCPAIGDTLTGLSYLRAATEEYQRDQQGRCICTGPAAMVTIAAGRSTTHRHPKLTRSIVDVLRIGRRDPPLGDLRPNLKIQPDKHHATERRLASRLQPLSNARHRHQVASDAGCRAGISPEGEGRDCRQQVGELRLNGVDPLHRPGITALQLGSRDTPLVHGHEATNDWNEINCGTAGQEIEGWRCPTVVLESRRIKSADPG